jgi:hypothetical protein
VYVINISRFVSVRVQSANDWVVLAKVRWATDNSGWSEAGIYSSAHDIQQKYNDSNDVDNNVDNGNNNHGPRGTIRRHDVSPYIFLSLYQQNISHE